MFQMKMSNPHKLKFLQKGPIAQKSSSFKWTVGLQYVEKWPNKLVSTISHSITYSDAFSIIRKSERKFSYEFQQSPYSVHILHHR